MGYRRIPTIYTLADVAGNEGFIVRMKGLKFGQTRDLMKLMDDEDFTKAIDPILDVVVKNIVSWNLEEEDGTPVESDKEGIESLEINVVLELVNDWIGAIVGVPEDLGKDSQSGGQFPGAPVTMEAL
jgi:hypothetical protein